MGPESKDGTHNYLCFKVGCCFDYVNVVTFQKMALTSLEMGYCVACRILWSSEHLVVTYILLTRIVK